MQQNATHKNKLTPKQNRALAVLVAGGTFLDAAAAAGVNASTVHRWNASQAFSEALQQQSRQTVHDATRRLTGTLEMAVDTFREVMQDSDERASVRLRAANYAATHALKLLEVSEVLERLDALEQTLLARNGGQL